MIAIWRLTRSKGSMTGAMLGGSVRRKIGEIPLEKRTLYSEVVQVLDMKSYDGQRFVALNLVSKAPVAMRMTPIRLSRSQAQELVALLRQASGLDQDATSRMR
ncbi:hypothetical protein ACQQ2N_15445 [Dokdonella sp. MW10]|uniref:hypothetical protein n=1 Tax=Dokdonella sp. MW10 TaxID=2992926 RepID=UPI003F808C1B